MKTDLLVRKSTKFIKDHLPEILTIGATIGVCSTVYLTRKSTKAEQILQNEGKLTGLEPIEIIETYARLYWPVAIAGGASIACLWGAHIIDKRREANLLTAYMAIGQAFEKYRATVKANIDEQTFCKIEEEYKAEMACREYPKDEDDELLFFEPHYGKFFNAKMEDVVSAEYAVNREMCLAGAASLATFMDELGLYPAAGSDCIGWSLDAGVVFYGYGWIEFIHEKMCTDDGLEYYYIKMPFEPTADFLDYGIGRVIT